MQLVPTNKNNSVNIREYTQWEIWESCFFKNVKCYVVGNWSISVDYKCAHNTSVLLHLSVMCAFK